MNSLLEVFDKSLRLLNRVGVVLACGILFTFVFAIGADILSRLIFNRSIYWVDEQAVYMLVWMAFLPSGSVIYKWAHIRFIVALRLMPVRVRVFLIILSKVICLVFCLTLVIYGMQDFFYSHHRKSLSVSYSTKWIALAIPTGGALMSINVFFLLLADFVSLQQKDYSSFRVEEM